MVVANPLSELNDLLGDDNDTEQLRSGTQEEELGSNPSARSKGTRPTESTANFTRARSMDGEGTRTTESTDNFTRGSNSAGEGTRPTESTANFTRASPSAGEGTQPTESTANFSRTHPMDGEGTRPTESTDNFTKNPTLHQSILTLEATKATTVKEAQAHIRKWVEFVNNH
jgi:hypothetical protein